VAINNQICAYEKEVRIRQKRTTSLKMCEDVKLSLSDVTPPVSITIKTIIRTSVANAVQLYRFWYNLEVLVQYSTFGSFLVQSDFLVHLGFNCSFFTQIFVPSFIL
jgi:hypothetical protein